MSKSERTFVDWLREQNAGDPRRVPIPIGDDMAAVRSGGGMILITADMLMDGIHFDAAVHTPEQIGRKALACSLSDCAAMAVRPLAAVVCVALPIAWTFEQAQGLYRGMEPLAGEFDVAIVGGDTNSWDHPLVLDVSVVAEKWPDAEPVRRDGARVGDGLYVSGRLGGSIVQHHLTFQPRVALARDLRRWLGERVHAMIDISDGLALDLWRMCQASGVGAELDAAALKEAASADAEQLAPQDGRATIDHVLYDGEDYELLCAIGGTAAQSRAPAADLGPGRPGRAVGRIIERGLELVHPDGRRQALEPGGWEHVIGD